MADVAQVQEAVVLSLNSSKFVGDTKLGSTWSTEGSTDVEGARSWLDRSSSSKSEGMREVVCGPRVEVHLLRVM